ILNKIRQMIATRKNFQTFGWGDFKWVNVNTKSIAAYTRSFEDESLFILNNLGAKSQTISLESKETKYIDILTQQVYNPDKITLHPYEYLWLKQEG
ncbi:MAG: alpha-glucosidase C-terminal domain-containing protein, partial [Anaerolineaceae bacterium]|nr:alpha-glucosidase C-terminal domain-containing protein [Anaerolineaceae bacterium]